MAEYEYLEQFFGGYFHEDWGEEYSWGYNVIETLHYSIRILQVYNEVSGEVQNIITDIENLLAMQWDEPKLREVVVYSLHCHYDPTSDKLTYREWLQWVLTSLKLSQTHRNLNNQQP